MSLPLFKLGALVIKQLSKPFAKVLKDKAKSHEKFKKYLILPAARIYHSADITLRMRILGLGKPETVPPLTEAKAIELGGEILSEFIVFGTAITIVLVEYLRNASKQAKKEETAGQNVSNLEKEQQIIKTNLSKTSELITQLNQQIKDQKIKIEDLNKKYEKLIEANKVKHVSKSIQTTTGRQVGKIILPSKLLKTAAEDVTNSVLYQCAEQAVNEMKYF